MRRICPVCKAPSDGQIPEKLRPFVPAGAALFRAVGCPECAMTGYRGRFSIVEVLKMNADLERRIGAGETADKIAAAARANGMLSLFESGLRHVLNGETTIDDLLRVVEPPQSETAAPAPARRPTPSPSAVPAPPVQPTGPAAAAAVATAVATPAIDLSTAFDLIDDLAGSPARGTLGRGACVLLVDDEDQLRRVMKDLLEREGYLVHEARDGAEALDEVDRRAPDIIVLDLNLPGMDGYTVLSQLRSRQATRSVPIIVLTAKGDEDNEVRVFELGADDFLTKPFRARALSARLEAVMGRRRA
jgi:CheY-like chemotaxis protein